MKPSLSVRFKAALQVLRAVTSINTYGALAGLIRESFTGAWQQNIQIDRTPSTLLAFSAVYACVTGIASDIAKMRIKLTRNVDGIWEEVTEIHGNNAKLSSVLKVLKKPNHFQNRIQFAMCWILSKLNYGNAYILKERDADRNVVAMYVLHPACVTPMVATDGSVFYQLGEDYLSQIEETKPAVPASEIIHDRMPELWHPLVGVSPLYACAATVTMGNKIQTNSTSFFANGSIPGGVVTVPGDIDDETAARLKANWEKNYGGVNSGRVAILGDGMTFSPVRMQADQSQLIDQLKWTVSDVARTFHYPEFKLGGPLPPYAGNVEALITSYYTDCLQSPIEAMELCLDEGLEIPDGYGTELDTDSLMRMDTQALYESNGKGVGGGWLKPNEARRRANLSDVDGGDTPYMQEQNWPLLQLASRTPPADAPPPAMPPPAPEPAATREAERLTMDNVRTFEAMLRAA